MADELIDLRKKNVIQPPVLPKRTMPGISGNIPFSPGRRVLTDFERQELTKVGWKDGDPIPQLSGILSQEAAQALPEEALRIKGIPAEYDPSTTPNFVPPPIVSIDSLSEPKRREIEAAINKMRKDLEEQAKHKHEQPIQFNDPSVAQGAAFAEMHADKLVIENDMKFDPKKTHINKRAVVTKQAPVHKPEPTIEPPVKQEPAKEHDQTDVTLTHCPHCSWDLSILETIIPTDDDRNVFRVALLGGQRFRKIYELFDGELRVTFRAPLAVESDRVMRQIFLDGSSGKVKDGPAVFRQYQEYQLAVCLESLWSTTKPVSLPTIDKYKVDDDETTTGLSAIVERIYSVAVTTDALRRILIQLLSDFTVLLAKLEVESRMPNFTKRKSAH